MKNKKIVARKSIGSFTLFVLLIFVLFVTSRNFFNKEIINNDPDSRVVLNTIDNREYGMPYINPEWIEYNRLSAEEKELVSNIPEKYVYYYNPVSNHFGTYASLPSSFNLRDEYATPIYDQGEEGLCWAYATATMMESNLKVTKGITTRFSPHHMSFVTAKPGYLEELYNPYSQNRSIMDGLDNFYEFHFNRVMLSTGVLPATNTETDNYKDSYDIGKIYKYDEIFDSPDLNYTVTQTVNFPEYQNTDEYKNMLKSFIKKYGAVKIFMYWSEASGYYNEEYSLFSGFNKSSPGHAVVLVGWDDNYGPKNKKGAWIIQNSYGKSDGDKMYYMSYDIDHAGIRDIVGIINIDEKDWDNHYDYTNYPMIEYNGLKIKQEMEIAGANVSEDSADSGSNIMAISGTAHFTYTKDASKSEKLNMINIITASQGGTYQVFISPDGNKNNYIYLDEINSDMPGIYSIKVTDNILLNNDEFSVKVTTSDGVFYQYANVFTNVVEEAVVENIHSTKTFLNKNNEGNYTYKITSYVPDNSIEGLLFSVYFNNKYQSSLSKFNVVCDEKAVFLLNVPYSTPMGTHIKINISDTKNTENVLDTIEFDYDYDLYNGNMHGSGTEDDPYMVSTIEQLRNVSVYPSAYYKLANDIDLSLASVSEQESIAYLGWISLDPFGGVFDGNGHTIRNINSLVDNTSYFGLFKSLNNATIKNLVIENFKSTGLRATSYNGIICNNATNSNIENVVISGEFAERVGFVIGTGRNVNINGLMLFIKSSSSFINNVIGKNFENCYLNNFAIISNSDIRVNNFTSKSNGYLIYDKYPSLNPSSVGNDNTNTYLVSDSTQENLGVTNISNVDTLKQMSIDELGFDTNIWKKNSDDTLPFLKFTNIDFISDIVVNDAEVTIGIGEKKNLNYSILPKTSFYKNVKYIIDNPDLLKVDGDDIIGDDVGSTVVHILSMDGSNISTDVNVTVTDDIVLYFNYGDHIDTIVSKKDSKINLPANQTDGKLLIGWKINNSSRIYNINDEYSVYASKEFIAVYDDNLFNNTKYDLDVDNKVISNICLTGVDSFIANLGLPSGYDTKVFNGSEEVIDGNISTGSVTKIYKGDVLIAEYTNSVIGDVYSDGTINSRDAGIIIQYLVDITELNKAQLYAADFSKDEQIRLNDVELIKHYVVHDFDYYERMCPNED